jgi:hypothetical protein
MMRDLHHDPMPINSAGSARRRVDGHEQAELRDHWPPKRRVSDGPVALLANDIRSRLAPICSEWSEREFETVVQRIARMKVRWMDLDRAD